VLEDCAEELFPGSTRTHLTDFMLCNILVDPVWRDRIPGVTHVDGTARVQVIRNDAPEQDTVRAILQEVKAKHGLPCLINTSFNGPDEPIAHTSQQARDGARRLGVDALILEDRMETYVPFDFRRFQ